MQACRGVFKTKLRKKLLISTDSFLPRWDGIARFLAELIPYLKEDFDVTVVCPQFSGKQPNLGVETKRFPLLKIRFGDIFFSWVDKQEIEQIVQKNDIVFNQTIGPVGSNTIKAAAKNNVPVISYVHSIEWELAARAVKRFKLLIRLFVKSRAKKLYNKADLLLIPSNQVDDELGVHGIKTQRRVVNLGVDANRFKPPVSKAAVKKAMGIEPSMFVIGTCGRLGREKDIPTLINAFRRLKRKDVILLIIGSGLREVKSEHKRIKFTGAVENVVPYLQAMDIFVLPSLIETSSLATMEAMATGLPVISTPVGSITEYLEDKTNGLLFPRKDIDALAQKIESLLMNRTLRERLGLNARKTIQQRHHWPTIAKEIKFVLHGLTP